MTFQKSENRIFLFLKYVNCGRSVDRACGYFCKTRVLYHLLTYAYNPASVYDLFQLRNAVAKGWCLGDVQLVQDFDSDDSKK